MAEKRKHRATGSAKGGRRPGAGRPKGAQNVLEYGAVKAIKATKLRLPEGATPEEAQLAGRALQRIVDVMEQRVGFKPATTVLKAATHLREEICGPVKQRVEHSFSGMTDEQLKKRFDEVIAEATAPPPPPPEPGE